jgi:hypothetical protein
MLRVLKAFQWHVQFLKKRTALPTPHTEAHQHLQYDNAWIRFVQRTYVLCGPLKIAETIYWPTLQISKKLEVTPYMCVIVMMTIAGAHNPDQWGFWEWLGQTPRLV